MTTLGGADGGVPLSISVIGGVRISWHGAAVLVGKRKPAALLAYLAAVPAHAARRENLATLLWGDKEEAKARNSLRQCLSAIGRELPGVEGAVLLRGKDTVGLRAGAFVTDVQAFAGQLRAGKIPDALEHSIGAGADLLGSLTGLTPELDEWVREYSGNLESSLVQAATEVLNDPATDKALRLRLCRVIASIDPLNEEACREAMQMLAEMDEIGAALKFYARLYDALDHELGMEPSAATQDLAVRIKTGGFDAPRPAVAAAAPLPVPRKGVPRVAILPFHALGPEPPPAYFAEGILEDTVAQLVRLQEVHVYSSNTTRRYRAVSVQEGLGGFDLDTEYLVTGTLRRARSGYRVTAQLVDAGSGLTEWAQTYSISDDELFEMQADIATNIAHEIAPAVNSAELRRIDGMLPSDLGAYHLTLKARDALFELNPESFFQARESLLKARALDAGFAPTSMALADWYSLSICQGWEDGQTSASEGLVKTTQDALRLSRNSGRALSMYGHNQVVLLGFSDEAAEMCERAIKLSPQDSEALLWSVPSLSYNGQNALAIETAQRAISLSPHDPFRFRYQHFLSIACFASGDYEGAARAGQRSFKLNPLYTSNLRVTAASLVEMGEISQAKVLCKHCLELEPGYSVTALRQRQPFKDRAVNERLADRLIQAGFSG